MDMFNYLHIIVFENMTLMSEASQMYTLGFCKAVNMFDMTCLVPY